MVPLYLGKMSITQEMRSGHKSRALGLFATVFVACWLKMYVWDVIKLRRQGHDAPKLPGLIGV